MQGHATDDHGDPVNHPNQQSAAFDLPGDAASKLYLSGAPEPAQVAAAGAWGVAGRGTLLVANLVATPFVIRLLGTSQFGVWALVQAALVWASLGELGMSTATTKFGSERYARHDALGEARLVWTAAALVLATAGSVAIVLATTAGPLMTALLGENKRFVGQAALALRLGCGALVVTALADVMNTPLVARLQWRRFTVINTSTNLLAIAATPLVLLTLGGGVTAAAGTALVAAIVYAITLFRASAQTLPDLWRPRVSRDNLRELASYGASLTIAGVAAVPLSLGERFVLASNHPATVVAFYAVAATVATALSALPEQIGAPLLPGLARLNARGDDRGLLNLYRQSLAGIFLVVTPAAVLLGFLAEPFLSLWAGPSYGANSTVPLLIALVGVWAEALAWTPLSYLVSSGRARSVALLNGPQVVPYLGIAWLLTDRFGADGAALVWSGRLVVSSLALFVMARRAGKLPVVPFSERHARSLLAPVVLAIACATAANLSHGLGQRCVLALLLATAYLAAAWWLVLTSRERSGLARLFARATGRNGVARP